MNYTFYYFKYGVQGSKRKVDWVDIVKLSVEATVGVVALWLFVSLAFCL